MTVDKTSSQVSTDKVRPRQKIRLGDLLVQHRIISESQLSAALKEQKKTGHKLGTTLIELGYVDEPGLLSFLSEQLHIPFIDLKSYPIDPDVVKTLPEVYARRYRVLVLKAQEDDMLVAMADPTNLFAYDELSRILKRRFKQALVREADLLLAIDMTYRRSDEITQLVETLHDELTDGDVDLQQMLQSGEASEAPVFRLLQTLFEDALDVKASDIHIEPDETVLRIRQRIDGVLQEQVMQEKRIAPALVQKLKLLANLDISEKRLPQDGRFHIRVKQRSIDVRLSTMPVRDGESVVMRLLDQSESSLKLKTLGMPQDLLERFRHLIRRPHGIVLVTGPTGSGKTTTLYAALNELNSPERKIITVEDPVEYRLERINQVQVHERIDLTFARVLRTALRQDPDVILVGEMRDVETTQIGLRAALTGHLVLSTLHTNDAVNTVSRLIDMGAEGYLIASALRGILAQRLVRRICDGCSEFANVDEGQGLWLESVGLQTEEVQFYRGTGCNQCRNTGYQGRIGAYELLEMDRAMSEALQRDDTQGFATAACAHPRYRPLSMVALDYAARGITTLDEVIRISADVEAVGQKAMLEHAT